MEEFLRIIRPIVKTKNYRSMKKYRHHAHYSCYTHSIKVAYLCYLYVKKHNSKVDLNELVIAALLHDYYLYDWHKPERWHRLHGFKHPRFSIKNIERDYFKLSKQQKNAIRWHMFPLTIIPPRFKMGWILQWCDKKASHIDYHKKK